MATKTRRKNPNAVSMGRLGGLARAKKLSKDERRRIARMGGLARMRAGVKR
jgi:hypothetical protein